MRAFIALPLPPDVQRALEGLHRQLAGSQADVKWVEREQLHVTLKFLGEITEAQRQAVEAMVRRVAEATPPFTATLDHLGAFPSVEAPRIIWVGLSEGAGETTRLAELIEQAGVAIPLAREERPFSAHVTLGRVRSPRRRAALVQALRDTVWQPPAAWRAASVRLYQSVLHAGGPQYTVLAEVPLGARG